MIKHFAAIAFAAVSLAACASPKYVVSDVTRFHSLPASPSGQTFVIATLNDEQGQSLSFRQQADAVTAKLVAMGLKAFSGPLTGADYVVTLDYSVSGPTPDIQSRTTSFGGGFGYGHPHWRGDGYWDRDWDQYTDTRQMFVRKVELNIYRGSTYSTPKKERVFEGRAFSAGLNGQVEPVLPFIIDALFKDFPGRSGEIQRVSIQVPEEMGDRVSAGPRGRSSY